jgi:hypothetical protein
VTKTARIASPRRGGVYIVVLGSSLIVAALSCGALMATRLKARQANWSVDAQSACRTLDSALEIARVLIRQDTEWRSNRPAGAWVSNQPLGPSSYTIEVRDAVDANLANRPHDAVVVKATATSGVARQMAEITLEANPVPLDALRCGFFTAGGLEVLGGKTLTVTGGVVATNGALNNQGTINGNVEAASITQRGQVNGTVASPVAVKAVPPVTLVDKYAALGAELGAFNSMDKVVLAPGRNPWGATNAEGVYVWRPSSDATLKDSRIHGTLVVICQAGRRLRIDNTVFIQPFRADYPSLVVKGECEIKHSNSPLSEASQGVSFNPTGAPYNGVSNNNTSENYPGEIQGLVYVTGLVDWQEDGVIRGMLFSASTANNAVTVEQASQVIYTPSLYTNPPQWFTSEVKMPVRRGTYVRLVD